MVKKTLVAGITIALAMALTACGKKEAPQTAEQAKAEKDAAAKTVRENPVYGDQVKAMDKAKADTEAAVKKREEAVGTADDKLKSGY